MITTKPMIVTSGCGKSKERIWPRGILRIVTPVLVLLSLWSTGAAAPDPVRFVRVPADGVAPSVVVTGAGVVHLVFGKEGKAYYARSADGGATFGAPVQLNTNSSVETGGERGPRIALGRNASVHVVWMAPRGQGVFYTRADAGGRFAAERNLLEQADADGVDVAADGRGGVTVVWLDSRRGPDTQSPVSKPIFMSTSMDDGRSFGRNTELRSDYPGRACACCSLRAVMDEGGLLVAFRGAYHSIRDMYLLRGGHAERVSDDGWKFEGCPMSGPFLQASSSPLVAWMSEGEVYWARAGAPRNAPHVPRNSARNYPLALANKAGEVLFAWTEGSAIHWDLYGGDGKLQSAGEHDGPPQKSRPTGFVSSDGSFTIIY